MPHGRATIVEAWIKSATETQPSPPAQASPCFAAPKGLHGVPGFKFGHVRGSPEIKGLDECCARLDIQQPRCSPLVLDVVAVRVGRRQSANGAGNVVRAMPICHGGQVGRSSGLREPPTGAHMSEPSPKLIGEDLFVEDAKWGRIYVRNKRPADVDSFAADRIVIFQHGATYGSTAFDMAFSGLSWMDYAAARGFDTYCLDLPGYGRSARPPQMDEPADRNPPFMRTPDAAGCLGTVVDFVRRRRGVDKVCLVGWSWGTAITASFTAANARQGRPPRTICPGLGPLRQRTVADPCRRQPREPTGRSIAKPPEASPGRSRRQPERQDHAAGMVRSMVARHRRG